ncbi:thiamine pyrophosphate-dependent enzyme [Geotoga petraea]|jgi:indolepyruvate ferredoxin oxidoreductase alpha subunit|uniref:Indolepyruvate oxidoreductase subunit IorA n=1 Tax=Geotoga petraea TaxID=28234 RepID=A0A1G6MU36_9BACT|nr:thiamine pyrophosphate-dependent enzyme [Geotoga petraea]MDK2946681.1 indolepyruvate ferredoxin oxidoreductase, alpha subunit [Geotoga sp.]TGG87360.1 indolepyruvate ferredoxin oxidoreductase [Geotoga petraea]SDC58505.1 indolepyruvate ferredoxin oxidoreductase alpha subunit [Geotoga petraea]
MKSMGEMLLRNEDFSEIVIGDTAIVRGMVEAGTRVVSAYPGSPTPEIANAISSIKREDRPFYFEFSTNEKVALELAFGASINGHLSTVFFKSVGLNVAADSFVQLSLLELIGGMVVVIGDDPGANSSQNEQDNRHYAKMTYMPVLEPSNVQEVYEMYLDAVEISQEMRMPVILRLTTHTCHAKEKVNFHKFEEKSFDKTPKFDPKNGPYVPITEKVHPMKRKALKKIKEVKPKLSKLNKLYDNGNKEKGIITMGVPYLSVIDVLEQADYKPDILKLAAIHPLDEKQIIDFLKTHDHVKIVEELDDVIEKEVKVIAYENNIRVKITGKKDLEEWIGEYTPEKVYEVLRNEWPDILPEMNYEENAPSVSVRPAQLCPGCGHRSAFYAIKKALDKEDITVADIGCHTLGFLPPYEMGQVLLSMGHSMGTASGLSLFNDERKVVAFLGDSTLFHAGLPGIVNAVFNNHNVTLVIMENGTTAMTGHQNHPGTGHNFNEVTDKIQIKKMLEGFGVKNVKEVDAYSQTKLYEMVKEATKEKGFSVIIAKHPCMLKFTREQRKKGTFKGNKVYIDQEICDHSYVCVEDFACPSFQKDENGDIHVHPDLCIGDGSCIQTCPVTAIKYEKM